MSRKNLTFKSTIFKINQKYSGIIIEINNTKMESSLIDSSGPKKRNLKEIMPSELAGKLKSKQDFYWYMDKQCE